MVGPHAVGRWVGSNWEGANARLLLVSGDSHLYYDVPLEATACNSFVHFQRGTKSKKRKKKELLKGRQAEKVDGFWLPPPKIQLHKAN